MEENKEIEEILYLKAIQLSEEQMIAFRRVAKAMSIFCNNIQEIVNNIFQEQIKPIADIIKEFMGNEEDKTQPIIKIKYGIIREIKPNQYLGLNKPKTIHCRSNC